MCMYVVGGKYVCKLIVGGLIIWDPFCHFSVVFRIDSPEYRIE